MAKGRPLGEENGRHAPGALPGAFDRVIMASCHTHVSALALSFLTHCITTLPPAARRGCRYRCRAVRCQVSL
eukprot:scaffold2276_cov140-Isochrysis_galbana.AAC.2